MCVRGLISTEQLECSASEWALDPRTRYDACPTTRADHLRDLVNIEARWPPHHGCTSRAMRWCSDIDGAARKVGQRMSMHCALSVRCAPTASRRAFVRTRQYQTRFCAPPLLSTGAPATARRGRALGSRAHYGAALESGSLEPPPGTRQRRARLRAMAVWRVWMVPRGDRWSE